MWHLAKALMVPGFLFSVAIVCAGWAQAQGTKGPTAKEIFAQMQVKNAERQAVLEHYSSNRTYQLEYNGAGGEHYATIVVHAEYTAPGRKQFTVVSEAGSKVLCKEVLRKLVEREEQTAAKSDWQRTIFSAETYDVELVGRERLEGVDTWVLKVEPKVESKIAYRGKVWVSADDFAMVRVKGEPAKSPSWLLDRASFDSCYMRRGDVWLPARNVSTTHVRIGGEATVTIDYGTYQVLSAKAISAGEEHADQTQQGLQSQPTNGKAALASLLR